MSNLPSVMKSPPSSEQAEEGILSAICSSADKAIPTCQKRRFSPEYFYTPRNKTIYNILTELWAAGKPIDLISFTQELRDRKLLEGVGGATWVTELFINHSMGYMSPENIEHYLDIVTEKFILRELYGVGSEIARQSMSELAESKEILGEAQTKLLDISLPGSQENAKSIEELATLALEGIMEAHDAKGAIPGLKTGLIDLDRKLGGLRPKQFIVIAGETGEGKTALALKIAETLAVKDQTPVGILSLEMSGVELCDRWIASLARVDLHRFLVYGGNDKDYPKIVDATDALKKSKIIVRDESDLSALQMRAEARQLKVQYGIELLIVDYIQLMQVTGDSDNHEKQIAGIAQAMKNCAKELGIVVIGLSQVNDDGRVRESRAIGHHADKMIFIRHQGENSYLDVKKNRGGPVGSVPVVFIRPFAQFESKAKNSLTNE